MVQYLQGNVDCLRHFLAERMPQVRAVLPEASYLAWLDLSDLGLDHDDIRHRLIHRARVALNDGTTFGGNDYRCCFRINLGCPRATLIDALGRIANSFL